MAERTRVVIDTDVAVGNPDRDVDDALAIVMANNSDQLDICGITLTYGNETLCNVERAMSELSSVANLSKIPIASGANSPDDFGKKTEATALLEEICNKGPITVLCLGPGTNLATFFDMKPDLTRRIDEVVLVAGRRRGQKFRTGNYPKSHPDLNFENDPAAIAKLLRTDTKLVFAPFEVSSKIWLTANILNLIEQNGTETATYLAETCRPWLNFWSRTFSTNLLPVQGFNPFDCLAVAWLTDRDLLSWDLAEMKIEQDSYDVAERLVQGTGGTKRYLHAEYTSSIFYGSPDNEPSKPVAPTKQSKNHRVYLHDVEREVFLERLIGRLR